VNESPLTAGLRIREAVRAVVLDPADRVLLVRFEFPDAGTRWALLGGGLEPGESAHDALRRELAEEAGLENIEIGPHIWSRLHIIPFIDGRYDGQREQIHLVRDETGIILEGDVSARQVVEDEWVFTRDMKSASPNWTIIET